MKELSLTLTNPVIIGLEGSTDGDGLLSSDELLHSSSLHNTRGVLEDRWRNSRDGVWAHQAGECLLGDAFFQQLERRGQLRGEHAEAEGQQHGRQPPHRRQPHHPQQLPVGLPDPHRPFPLQLPLPQGIRLICNMIVQSFTQPGAPSGALIRHHLLSTLGPSRVKLHSMRQMVAADDT